MRSLEPILGELARAQGELLRAQREGDLAKNAQGDYDRRIRNAYAMTDYAAAKAELEKILRQLERINPSAARSLEEELEETLTVHRLGVGWLLRRTLASTNRIESCLSTVERVARPRETLARRRASLALDGYRLIGGAKEIPASERLSGTGTLASPDELVVDSASPGRVTCTKSRAATFNLTGDNFTEAGRDPIGHGEGERLCCTSRR